MSKVKIVEIDDEGVLVCPHCFSIVMDCLEDYENYYTHISAEYIYEDRGTPYNMILRNEWYIPKDGYNQDWNYCSCCGKKLHWKEFFIKHYGKTKNVCASRRI